MTGIFVALFSLLATFMVGRIMLRKYIGPLKAREQCFKFHELRDRLQVIAVEGKIDTGSQTYQLLLFIINLSIRNAGVMKLSEILKAAKAIEKRVNASTSERVFADIRSHNQEVQQLSADVFDALARMLISNDDVTFLFAKIVEFNTDRLKGLARNALKSAIGIVMPERSEALQEAFKYRHWGNALSSGMIAVPSPK